MQRAAFYASTPRLGTCSRVPEPEVCCSQLFTQDCPLPRRTVPKVWTGLRSPTPEHQWYRGSRGIRTHPAPTGAGVPRADRRGGPSRRDALERACPRASMPKYEHAEVRACRRASMPSCDWGRAMDRPWTLRGQAVDRPPTVIENGARDQDSLAAHAPGARRLRRMRGRGGR